VEYLKGVALVAYLVPFNLFFSMIFCTIDPHSNLPGPPLDLEPSRMAPGAFPSLA